MSEPRPTDFAPRWLRLLPAWVACAFSLSAPLSLIHYELGAVRNWQLCFYPIWLLMFLRQGGIHGLERLRPSRVMLGWIGASSFVWLFLYHLSQFYDFRVSGVDFSIFDWMLVNTARGRFMYSPIYDVNHFGIHPNYVLLALVPLHAAVGSPLFLLLVNTLALWAASIPLWALVRHTWKGDGWALLICLGYLTCPLVTELASGGFRVESFYPLSFLWLAYGHVTHRPYSFAAAALLSLAIKEDAAIYLLGFCAGIYFFDREQRRRALLLSVGCVALLALNLGVLQPYWLKGSPYGQPFYLAYWESYGPTLREAAVQMVLHPLRVARDVLTSGWYRFFGPFLFLPLLSRIPLLTMLPMVAMFGAASYVTMREFYSYFPAPLLPFALWGQLESRFWLDRWRVPRGLLLLSVLTFPLIGEYARLHPPQLDRQRALNQIIEVVRQGSEQKLCVPAILFPHVPYDLEPRLLDGNCRTQPTLLSLVHPDIDPYPLSRPELREWITQGRQQATAKELPGGFILLRGQL